MKNKIQNLLKQIQNKINEINHLYTDYFLCNAFLSLIIFKINKIFFQISWIYLYPSTIFISIIFLNKGLFIINNIKNTYLFNYFLYYFLIIKNNIYKIIFHFFEYIEDEKYQKFIIFSLGFILSSWSLNLFFLVINNFYDLSIIVFIFLLILNIFNLIEKRLIFNEKNLTIINQELKYNQIQSILNITNQKFKKNSSLLYIQKRYMHFNEFKKYIKKHGITILSSTLAGILFTTSVQIKSVNVQKQQHEDNMNFKKQQHEDNMNFKKQQHEDNMNFKKQQYEDNMNLTKEQLKIQRRKNFDDFIVNNTEKIKEINNKEYQIRINMNSKNFWSQLNMTGYLNDLQEEKKYLKRKREEAEEEFQRDSFSFLQMKKNIENENLNKKPKLDDNFFNDD